jgi:hypothetical protein
LAKKGMAQATSSVCDQDFDRTPKLARGIVESVDALRGGEVNLNGLNLRPLDPKRPGRVMDVWLVGRDYDGISLIHRKFGQFEANAA